MLKILIVDDERMTREGIRKKIDWALLGIKTVEEASNGLLGVEKAFEIAPDIMLCDVKMPKMNGIECAKAVKERFPFCKIIFLSGYPEKEYLKSAIQLEAVDYIEKPLNMAEVSATIQKAVNACMAEREIRKQKEQILDRLQQSMPLFRQKLLSNILENKYDYIKMQNDLEYAGINFTHAGEYIAVVIRLYIEQNEFSSIGQIHRDYVSELAEEKLACFEKRHIAAFIDLNQYAVVIRLNMQESSDILYSRLEFICNSIKEICGTDFAFSMGIGNRVEGFQSVSSSYKLAIKALSRQFYIGYRQLLFYTENEKSYRFDDGIKQRFCDILNNFNRENADVFLEEIIQCFKQHRNTDVGYVKEMLFSLVLQIFEEAHKKGISLMDYEDQKEFLWEVFLKLNTLDEIGKYIKDKTALLFDRIARYTDKSKIVGEIQRYIEDNYAGDLSIDDIAEHLGMNAAYICVLFKKELEKTINQYITEWRISKAKKLIGNPTVKLYQVAEKVGFRDQNYFAKVFKRVTGVTPSEYREMNT